MPYPNATLPFTVNSYVGTRLVEFLRRTVWLAGNYVRDFFIDSRPETADRFKEQLAHIRSESDQALLELQQLSSSPSILSPLKQSGD